MKVSVEITFKDGTKDWIDPVDMDAFEETMKASPALYVFDNGYDTYEYPASNVLGITASHQGIDVGQLKRALTKMGLRVSNDGFEYDLTSRINQVTAFFDKRSGWSQTMAEAYDHAIYACDCIGAYGGSEDFLAGVEKCTQALRELKEGME